MFRVNLKSEDHLRFLAGKLTAELLQRELRENRDKNIILSPFSILSLISVAAFSAAGKTKEEILSKAENSPYIGEELTGRVKLTIAGGSITYDELR